MSIFKDSFHQSIKDQLATRQAAINNRTPKNLQYYNSRNAWIRLSSSVNVLKRGVQPTPENLKNPANYDNTLANQYVLQGGILNNNQLRSGLGSDFSYAYSNKSANGEAYRLGIRPMPGITGIDIKSKGAYGSLREATVNFQCWDIKQLEDLEMLYMRQGYTLLLEWGWSPCLTNGTPGNNYIDAGYSTAVHKTDIINNKYTKEQLFGIQYACSTDGKWKGSDGKGNFQVYAGQGNYDSMFGYIKNYSWKARMDGGYDCQTTIISMGEVIESLKINYSPLNSNSSIKETGLITPHITNYKGLEAGKMTDLEKMYSQNILAGMFYEIRELIGQIAGGWSADNKGKSYTLTDGEHKCKYNIFRRTINIKGGENAETGTGTIGKSDEQIYITLESLCLLLNNYVLLSDKTNKKPFAALSVYEKDTSTLDANTGEGYLLALAHPLQVSVDPTVCLIKNQLWIDGISVQTPTGSVDPNTGTPTVKFNHTLSNAEGFIKTLIRNTVTSTYKDYDASTKIITQYIKENIQGNPENLKEATRVFKELYSTYKIEPPNQSSSWGLDVQYEDKKVRYVGKTLSDRDVLPSTNTFYDLLEDNKGAHLTDAQLKEILGENGKSIADGDPVADEQKKLKEKQDELNKKAEKSAEASKFLENLDKNYYLNNDYSTELGIIGNIYVNINMLYNMCVDDSLASQDKKEKKEIALYDYIKNILSKISSTIGEVNTFDLFVDPDGNTARIIDINYVDRMSATDAYDKAFELQLHNLNSVVRSYSLESKIFPEQGTIVAIGAQVQGGALGTDTNTLTDFNRSVIDRIIPVKEAPTSPEEDDPAKKLSTLTDSLGTIYDYFTGLDPTWYGADGEFNVDEAGKYQGALRDLINFFKAIGKSKTKNKAIIPTVLSVEMDGIGGMVIGNLFRIPSDILPRGYKGAAQGGIGSKLGYIVTGIGHSIQNNDWVTKVEAQTIILDEPQGIDIPFASLSPSPSAETEQAASSGPITINVTTNAAGTVTGATVAVSKDVKKNLDEIEKACIAQGLTNKYIIIAIKANVMKESGGVPKNENLNGYANTSNDRIRTIFGSRFANVSEANLNIIKKNVVEFSEYVYGLKSGKTGKNLGNTQSGDGYKFRGRGYIQLTGRDLYTRCGKALGKDFVNNPDSINTSENAAASTVWYIKEALKTVAPRSDYKLNPSNPQPKDQLQANLLITNCIGGVGLRLTRPGSGYWVEILNKVDKYSTQFT